MDSIVRLSSIIHKTDYWRRGRTIDKLGIDNLSVGELVAYVNEGILEGEKHWKV
jgi:opine dehydrogenase